MAKSSRTHLDGVENELGNLAPHHMTKEQFGRRLYKLMIAKGWRQSELARQAGMGRDAISTYVTGRSFPTPINAKKLADALSVSVEELLPNVMENAIAQSKADFEFKTSAGDPNRAWIKIDRAVSLATAVKIAELIKSDGETSD